jgi:septal ring factor EnvC (AmiA/AmiB activator)
MLFGAIDPALGGVAIALVTSLATYLVAARNLSGKIKNSDASELWAESRSIREWSTERVKELDEHIDRLEDRLSEVEKANHILTEENRKLTRELFELRASFHDIQTQNGTLMRLLEQEKSLVSQLRWEAEHSPRRRYTDPGGDPPSDEPGRLE